MKGSSQLNWNQARKHIGRLNKRFKSRYREYVDTYLKDRTLRSVERFVLGWMALFILATGLVLHQSAQLKDRYLVDSPAPGGNLIEGIVGDIGGINPVFPGDDVNRSAQKLIFSSLFTYDSSGRIVPDLVADYQLSEDETIYTVFLLDDVYWHDGMPVTADDVAFTFNSIKNPDVGSPLQVSWQGIEVRALEELVVEFELPNPFAPFLTQLTTGILPAHIWADVEPDRMRVSGSNQNPVGSGPFVFNEISGSNQIRLDANPDYHHGAPLLDRFTIAVYEDEEALLDAYNKGELSSLTASTELDISAISNPDNSTIKLVDTPGQVFAFYNLEKITDRRMRQALTRSLNIPRVISQLPGSHAPADSPLLPEHLGYKPAQLKFDVEEATKLLEAAGWQRDEEGYWTKDGEELSLELATRATQQHQLAARSVAEQWQEFGVQVTINEFDSVKLQQEVIRPRNFDVLLLGIDLGNDPDVFAYWHSSQKSDTGLNLSQYESELVDLSLEDGRTRSDQDLRAAKYETFQDQWRRDAPATALYRMHTQYVSRDRVGGLKLDNISNATGRYHNVTSWTINTVPASRLSR